MSRTLSFGLRALTQLVLIAVMLSTVCLLRAAILFTIVATLAAVLPLIVRIPLGEQPAQRREVRHSIGCVRRDHQLGSAQFQAFDDEMAEMLVEPRAPGQAHVIARLQDRPHARTGPSPHQPEMAPMLTRHDLENGVRLAVTAHAQHDAFVGPVHVYPWSMIFSDLPTPAEPLARLAGPCQDFAQAGNRLPLFGIMR